MATERRGLSGIDVASGVNVKGEPFCHVAATAEDGLELLGQLDPFEVRRMALGWLEAAEAAVHDAAVFRELVETLELAPSTAAVFLEGLRRHRGDSTTSTRRPPEGRHDG
jgi:hypothetical protein